ncbi:hypothetical protein D3C81_1848050 [compost metagenome]
MVEYNFILFTFIEAITSFDFVCLIIISDSISTYGLINIFESNQFLDIFIFDRISNSSERRADILESSKLYGLT